MANTKARSQAIQTAAMRLVTAAGIEWIDSLDADARRTVLAGLKKQLQADTGCTFATANKHIAQACRRQRYPLNAWPANWGGARPGAGRPKSEEKEAAG